MLTAMSANDMGIVSKIQKPKHVLNGALQDIREYELDYEAAKKAAAAVAIEAEKEEERRIKMLEKNPLGELPGFEEEEDFNFGTMLAALSLWVNGLLNHTASINESVQTLACTSMCKYSTVQYCTVLYCTVLYCTVDWGHNATSDNAFASFVPHCRRHHSL